MPSGALRGRSPFGPERTCRPRGLARPDTGALYAAAWRLALPVPAAEVRAIDTNGAGDMFAGAFLFAVTHGYSHAQAARLANGAAATVVAQYGNRLKPEQLQEIRREFEASV